MFDLISVGDCMIDHFFSIHDAHTAFTVKKEIKELCIRYGDKIGADSYKSLVAGNNANNAVGASRLGLNTAFYVNIGEDPAGKRVVEKLKEEGVSTRYVTINKGMQSNASAVINFQGERTILVYHQPWKYNLPDMDRTKWVYFSSVSPSFQDSSLVTQVENYVQRVGCKLAFNPGTYQLQLGVKKLSRLLSLTNVLFVNVQEAERILGVVGREWDCKRLMKGLRDLGVEVVVMTDGGRGSYSYNGEKFYKLDIFKAELLEMTGSGDAYATGFVAGLFYGKDIPEAMRWGAANGASVVEQIGPQAGLLTREGMRKRLKENSRVVAKEI